LLGLALVWAWRTAGVLPAADDLELVAEKWQLNRIRKSAHEKRDHFYDGILALRNRGKAKLELVRAQVAILDVRGNSIQNSGWIDFGDLPPGLTQEKRFVIPCAVDGAEVLVKVCYRQNGNERTAEFSSARGGPPTLLEASGNETAELRLLGYEFEQPGIGKGRSSEAVLTIRVRNLASVAARRPTARLEFFLSSIGDAAKSSGKKAPTAHQKEASPQARNVKIIEVLLDENEIPPGATRVFAKKIKGVPEYAGMNIVVSAEWPATPAAEENAATTCEAGGEIKVENLKIESAADGSSTLRLTIVNHGEAIGANKLKVGISFLNDKNETVAKVEHVCAEDFPAGKTVEVVIAGQKIPPHSSYDVVLEF